MAWQSKDRRTRSPGSCTPGDSDRNQVLPSSLLNQFSRFSGFCGMYSCLKFVPFKRELGIENLVSSSISKF